MKMFKAIAISAVMLTGVSTAFAANPFDVMGGINSLDQIGNARYATVLTVNDAEARTLSFDNDVASVQQRIKNNQFLLRSISDQGFTVDQIVGIEAGGGASVTLFAL
ncbi:hypothetical protein [Devosia sp. 2618]|uniref:hypothetical protein n=1 Tax=Devosia sp. 2618 TaxID=3156454 RepID=UPI003399F0ED